MDIKDKVVVITGASDGIGREIALYLAKYKTKLALLGRNKERLKEVSQKCSDLGSVQVATYAFDIRDYKATKSITADIVVDFGNVDVLINNAGVWHLPQPLEKIGEEKAIEVIETNLTGLIRITAMFLPTLKKQAEAAIINISSRSGKTAQQGQTVYGASKWGVRGFTETLKEDLKGTSVRVAGVYQGKTKTNLFKKANDPRNLEGGIDPKNLAEVVVFMLTRPDHTWIHDLDIEG